MDSRSSTRAAVPGRARDRVRATALLAAAVWVLSACLPTARAADGATDRGPADRVRLGYFATVTHAPALVGLARGTFADALGGTSLETQVFHAGPAAIEALDAGAVDAAFVGPNPAISGFLRSEGASLRIVSGAAVGGAQLVVRPGIERPADLVGTTLASPQLGGTQDVALRTWLADHGLVTRLRGGGDVSVTPTASAVALQLFRDGTLDGAWLPEPWASRLVLEAGGHVLVDERDLWPDGRFPTTYLIVSARFLAEHPATVRALVEATVQAIDWIVANPATATQEIDRALDRLTGTPLAEDVLRRALEEVEFTADPVADALPVLRDDAARAGTAPDGSLVGILDLRLLEDVLADRGEPGVPDAGLGQG